ncbi:MAG: hypothetical protein ACI4JQ_02135 [Ruminococcus sp.]
MTAKEIKDKIMSFTNDVLLDYPEHDMIFINPCSTHKFIFSYENIDKTYNSIDELMGDKIFDGKSLSEIAPMLSSI